MEKNIYRCTFTNGVNKVGEKIDSFRFESLPSYLKGDYVKIKVSNENTA